MKAHLLPKVAGFSLIEVLVVVAGLSALSSGAYMAVKGVRESANATKLESDVALINRTINIYQANGGDLSDITGATNTPSGIDILDRLKTKGNNSGLQLEMQSAVIDPRIRAIPMPSDESSTSRPRAIWTSNGFKIASSGPGGIREFVLDDEVAAAPTTLARENVTKVVQAEGWHWEGSTEMAPERSSTWSPSLGEKERISQGFPDQPRVGPSGIVPVTILFDGAGYDKGQLALASLDGMGSDNYDLDSTEGQRDFIMELLRKVIEEDNGHVIMDSKVDKPVSVTSGDQSRVVENRSYEFRPGDTLAVLLIPNGTFEEALQLLTAIGELSADSDVLYQLATNSYKGGYATNEQWVESVIGRSTNSSQLFAVSSLSRTNTTNGNNFPFYNDKFASIGDSGTVFAIEDLIVDSDQDFEDVVFSLGGIETGGSYVNVISDPYSYYTANGRWNSTQGGDNDKTLGQVLIDMGIVDPNSIPQ